MAQHDLNELKAILQTALRATAQGRKVLQSYFGRVRNIEEKFQAGLVSEADRESERTIAQILKTAYPDIEFLGEESFAAGIHPDYKPTVKGQRWILDPLDGTTNYIHQFPIYCISLGLEWDGEIVVAVIDVPELGETYTAVKGGGSYVNGRKLQVSQTKNLKDSFLATGFFGENFPALEEQLKIFSSVVRKCRGVRRAGAAAYDLCQVARGVFDGYWEKNLGAWDSAAGILIVSEAGGVISNYQGEAFHPYMKSIVAAAPGVMPHLLAEIKMNASNP